ncbi:MAG TPA: AzlC family ABC transporter permease [Tepidiformaceae bacterium]|nr:AzlC family ABC transporter permease [Tepidiformaceae bacterium]
MSDERRSAGLEGKQRQGSGVGYGVRVALPIGVAVGAFGISFGVLARAEGLGILAPLVMSLTTFSGASQFAIVSVLKDGGGIGAAATAAILLVARYLPIGVSVAPAIRGGVLARFARSQFVVDESWAVSNRGNGTFDGGTLLGAGLTIYLCWFAGTVLGVLGGDFLGDPEDFGLDAAFAGLFLALLWTTLRSRRAVVAAAVGAVVALVLVPFTEPGIPIIAAGLGCLAGWRRG